jgi:hypothetical protein
VARVVAITGEHVGGVELDVSSCFPTISAPKSDTASASRITASPPIANCFCRFFWGRLDDQQIVLRPVMAFWVTGERGPRCIIIRYFTSCSQFGPDGMDCLESEMQRSKGLNGIQVRIYTDLASPSLHGCPAYTCTLGNFNDPVTTTNVARANILRPSDAFIPQASYNDRQLTDAWVSR